MRRLWSFRRKTSTVPSDVPGSSRTTSVEEVEPSAPSVSPSERGEEIDTVADLPPSRHKLRGIHSAHSGSDAEGVEGIGDFFASDENGTSAFDEIKLVASMDDLSRASTGSSWTSTLSMSSYQTFLPTSGGYGLPLNHLCRIIDAYPSIREAGILSSECYTEPIRFGILHRFLLLELRREGRKTIWIRLDRTRLKIVGTASFLRAGAQTPANDVVQISASRTGLVGSQASRENRQVFGTLPHLGDLLHPIYVIGRELTTYRLLSRNCWFFVSLIQQHLGVIGDGMLADGELPAPNIDQPIRIRIEQQVNIQREFQRAANSPGVTHDPILDFELADLANYARYELRLTSGLDSDYPHLLAQKSLGSFVWMAIACRHIAHGSIAPSALSRLEQVLRSGEGLDGLYAMILFGNSAAVTLRLLVLALIVSAREPLPLHTLLKYSPPNHFPPDADVLSEARHLAPILNGVLDDTPVSPYHISLKEYLSDEARSGPFSIDTERIMRLHILLNVFRSLDLGNGVPGLERLDADEIEMCVHHALGLTESRALKDKAHSDTALDGRPAWTAAVCQFVLRESRSANNHTWYHQLHKILCSGTFLDTLYTTILEECCSEVPADTVMLLLPFLLFAEWPLNISDILDLASDHLPPNTQLSVLLRALWPLCIVLQGIELNGNLGPCHRPFLDFLLDERRSGRFFIDAANAHMVCAECCIAHMNRHLAFNIANTSSSFYRQDIGERVTVPLFYSCGFWPGHALTASRSGVSTPSLACFLETRALRWLETMSFVRPRLEQVLETLKELAITTPAISVLLLNIIRFADMFAEPIETCAPHIYVSALAFIPSCSVFPPQQDRCPGIGRLVKGRLKEWPSPGEDYFEAGLHMDWFGNLKTFAIFSPDGASVALNSDTQRIYLLDAWTSALIGKPMKHLGHGVNSIAFSPDGTQIASACQDQIFLWDTRTSAAIGRPMTGGHSKAINCVVWSIDGTRIVSASDDQTIRFWDVQTGAPLGEPLAGHSAEVLCLAASPDGARIASGAGDATIRLWDALTGAAVAEPLLGHTGGVTAIAFSPDGMRIASGAMGERVHLWDASNGHALAKLFVSSGQIRSLAFSPSGVQLASYGRDQISLWDISYIRAGIPAPIISRTDLGSFGVCGIAFSADGTRIASVSYDAAIRLRDTRSVLPTGVPLDGHADNATTPDNRNILPQSPSIITGHSRERGITLEKPSNGRSMSEPEPSGQLITSRSDLDQSCLSLEDTFKDYSPKRTSSGAFILSEKGWIEGQKGELLLWVPLVYRRPLVNGDSPRHSLFVLDPDIVFDFRDAKFGKQWTECRGPLQR